MKLYLVRHGAARSKEEDPERPLSDAGATGVTNVARWLGRDVGPRPERVYHSPKLRARQTAEILVETADLAAPLDETESLTPLAEVEPLARDLEAVDEDRMLVGHLPHLSRLASHLICGRAELEAIEFAAAGALCLSREANGGAGVWKLEWLVSPELVS